MEWKGKQFREAYDILIEEFRCKFEEIKLKGHGRPGQPDLSWSDLQKIGFVKDALYERSCDLLHDGSKDPRHKSNEFHAIFQEMVHLMRTWRNEN